jgi:hypothetical protein
MTTSTRLVVSATNVSEFHSASDGSWLSYVATTGSVSTLYIPYLADASTTAIEPALQSRPGCPLKGGAHCQDARHLL